MTTQNKHKMEEELKRAIRKALRVSWDKATWADWIEIEGEDFMLPVNWYTRLEKALKPFLK